MASIPRDFIDTVIDKVDIVDVISENVSLKRTGSKYVGLCPFHNEKTASFTVDGDKQMFYCFGCHVGGNIVTYLEKKDNLTFVECIEELAKRANMTVPYSSESHEPAYSKDMKAKILEANKDAARFYFNTLFEPEGAEGLEYFVSRGLTENIIKRFGLGYAPDSRNALINHLKAKGYDEETIVTAGLARKNDFGITDNFRTRVMFPIISPNGDILGFGGRVLDHSKPKYLNTGDTPVFNKRKNLYALNILKKNNKGRAIIGEGYMDVIGLNMAGFNYGVASLGTAVTPEQVRLLKRYVKDIYICYDGDQAGISATHKVIDLMHAEKIKPRIIELPLGVDPDEYIKEFGADAFSEMMRSSRTSIDYLIDEVKNKLDMNNEEQRAEFAQKATEIVKKYAFDSIETEMYLKKIHTLSGFSMEALYNNVEIKTEKARQPDVNYAIVNKFESVNERALIAVLTDHPDLIEYAENNVKEEYFTNESYLKIFKYLCEKPSSITELLKVFDGDEQCASALSAVGIETNVFGSPGGYLEDCCLKMHIAFLERKRDALKEKLNGQFQPEEKIAFAGEIAMLDREIKNLKVKF